MNDGDALLRAILAQPGEDTPRLVFADWLEENGQPERAEFIRLQIELTLPGLADRVRFRREKALLYNFTFNAPEWLPPGWTISRWTPEETGRPVYPFNNPAAFVHRGFVRHVRCTLSVLLRDAGALFAAHPVETVYPLSVFVTSPNGFAHPFSTTPPSGSSEEVRRFHALLVDCPALRTDHAQPEVVCAEVSALCVAFGRSAADKLRQT